jgi:hypothetical protein
LPTGVTVMKSKLSNIIEESVTTSVATKNEDEINLSGGGSVSLLLSLANQSSIVPAWWSKSRDTYLRKYWKMVDYLAGAIYTMEAKLTAIPFKILPKDQSNRLHVRQAGDLTELLNITSQYGNGWSTFYQMFLEDLFSTDNGAFAEIIGEGDPAGPIIGRPITVAHLDSSRCQRTGSKEFPVLYTDDNGTVYKLHYTRVIYYSSMTSPIKEMNGVGYCAIGRCLNIAQHLYDVLTYKMEKLGSRPHRGMMVTRGGLDPEDIRNAFSIADNSMSNAGLSRFSKTVVIGDASLIEADVKLIDLAGLPDGFNEETSTLYGMASIALAFGVDMRELWPAMAGGQTRADAIMQHMKQRGKGPGQILFDTERMFNSKYLPPHLYMTFDYQDDAQDRQVAETRNIRAMSRERDFNTGGMDIHTVRETMETDGDIINEQRVHMELQDGRLSDGTSVLNLFYSKQTNFNGLLDLGVEDPLDYKNVNLEELDTAISDKTREVRGLIANAPDGSLKNDYIIVFYALMNLAKHYGLVGSFPELTEKMPGGLNPMNAQNQEENQDENTDENGKPKPNWNDNRVRRIDDRSPTDEETNPPQDNLEPSWDDTEASMSV